QANSMRRSHFEPCAATRVRATRSLANPAVDEECAEVTYDEIWDLEGGVMATGVELRPVHDVAVVALGERPDGLEVVGEHRDTDASVTDCRLGSGGAVAVG